MAPKNQRRKVPSFPPEAFACGTFEITVNRDILIKNEDAFYRCPFCEVDMGTRRKEVLRKHIVTVEKKVGVKIPSMKQKCRYCSKNLEAAKSKKKIHLSKCLGFLAAEQEIENNNIPPIANNQQGIQPDEVDGDKIENQEVIEAQLEINKLREDLANADDKISNEKNRNNNLVEDLQKMAREMKKLQLSLDQAHVKSLEGLKGKRKLRKEMDKLMFDKQTQEDQAAVERAGFKIVIEEQKTIIEELNEELQTVKEKHIFQVKHIEEEQVGERDRHEKEKKEVIGRLENSLNETNKLQNSLDKLDKRYKEKKLIIEDLKVQLKSQQIDEEKKVNVESSEKLENAKFIRELKLIIKHKDKLLVDADKELEKSRREIVEFKRRSVLKEIKADKIEPKPLGEGGYGDIWLGKLGREEFAIKRCKGITVESITEAVMMLILDSPYLMKATAVTLRPEVSLAMELMTMDLDKFLDVKATDRGASWRKIVVHDCAHAVSYLHDMNVMHRDIKPQNFLVKFKEDGSILVKLTDFGFCHVGLKAVGWMGTRGYIAPEMYQDEKPYDQKVDDWSLGAVLYEVLTDETLVKKQDAVEEELRPKPDWTKVKAYMPAEVTGVKDLLVLNPKDRKSSKDLLKRL